MSRMGREFSLVLLGSGMLTAGYFLAPSPVDELAAKADDQAADRVHGSTGTTHRSGHFSYYPLFFVHSMGYSGSSVGRPGGATAGVTRGGIGAMGRSASVSS